MMTNFPIRFNHGLSYAHWLTTMLVGLSAVMGLFPESQPYSPVVGALAFAMLASQYVGGLRGPLEDYEEVLE
jgi:hypothetical protein